MIFIIGIFILAAVIMFFGTKFALLQITRLKFINRKPALRLLLASLLSLCVMSFFTGLIFSDSGPSPFMDALLNYLPLQMAVFGYLLHSHTRGTIEESKKASGLDKGLDLRPD